MATKTHVDRFGIALEAALRHLELESALSMLLCEPIKRIAEGTYGRCLGCSVMIAPERLRALPWVQLCAACQDAADHRNEQGNEQGNEQDRSPASAGVCPDRVIFIDTINIKPTGKKR